MACTGDIFRKKERPEPLFIGTNRLTNQHRESSPDCLRKISGISCNLQATKSVIHKTTMYQPAMHSPELLKGRLQTIILKLLSDHGKMYGYELTQRVKELSSG